MKLDFTLRLCVESDKEVLHLVDERRREWKKRMERQGNGSKRRKRQRKLMETTIRGNCKRSQIQELTKGLRGREEFPLECGERVLRFREILQVRRPEVAEDWHWSGA
jgi:hypothetical protein